MLPIGRVSSFKVPEFLRVATQLADNSSRGIASILGKVPWECYDIFTISFSKTRSAVSQYDRFILMAEDELTQYSSDARKVEKLRRKMAFVPPKERAEVKEQLRESCPDTLINKILIEQRQAAALPFWGIAGLGLLFGISMFQPLDLLATVVGGAAAVSIQRLGWKLQAKRLALRTLDELDGTKVAEADFTST
jgi:hypothetical protein